MPGRYPTCHGATSGGHSTSSDCKLRRCGSGGDDGADLSVRRNRLLFMGGSSCIVIGFNFATQIGCKASASTRVIAPSCLTAGLICQGPALRPSL